MKLTYQNKTGLFTEHRGVSGILHHDVRLTIPAREALEKAGATVTRDGQYYTVTMYDVCPRGLVAVQDDEGYVAVRLDSEPPYPSEYPNPWTQLDWTPCPKCGAPLVWYEAGYVPGYRVCAKPPHHHVLAM